MKFKIEDNNNPAEIAEDLASELNILLVEYSKIVDRTFEDLKAIGQGGMVDALDDIVNPIETAIVTARKRLMGI